MNKWIVLVALLAATPAFAHNGVDDEPHHGGVVKSYTTLHFEAASLPAGGVQIYFSDATGEPLPASAVSDVAVEIAHPSAKTEYVEMAIDPTGVFWQGKGMPLTDAKATMRIGFTFSNAPANIEVAVDALIAGAAKKPAAKKQGAKTPEKPNAH